MTIYDLLFLYNTQVCINIAIWLLAYYMAT